MSPEICSVEGLRSGLAAFMRGLHFAMADVVWRRVRGNRSQQLGSRGEGTTSFVKRCRALVRRGGGESGGRFCGREHDKGYADDHQDDRTPQKSHPLVRKLEGHRAHDEGVRQT